MEKFEVPEKFCAKGHVIPLNGAVVGWKKGPYGTEYPIVLKTPRLICAECAIEGGGEMLEGMRHRPVRGKKLEKLGQESFLAKVPARFID